MTINETEKIAIVTGAARGIGLCITKRFLDMGMTVVAVDLREDLLKDMPQHVGDKADKLDCRALDVTDSDGFNLLAKAVVDTYGRIDVLVNNAGITRDGLLMRMSDDDWLKVINVNLNSAFYGTRAVATFMLRQRSGSIINISSYSGLEGNRGQCNYAASKAGLLGLTKTTAKELAAKNVRCNAVAPGFIQTDMTDVLPQQAKDMALEQIPMKQFGHPEDIANAVAFLASESAGYITGQVISVDGGMHT